MISDPLYLFQVKHGVRISLVQGVAPACCRKIPKSHTRMTMPAAPIKLVHSAHLFADAFLTYVRQFGLLALFALLSMKEPLALLPLLEHQPDDLLFALLPVVRVASVGNYSYSVTLEDLPKQLVKAEAIVIISRNTSIYPICRKCLRIVRHAVLSRRPYSSFQELSSCRKLHSSRQSRTTTKTSSSPTRASGRHHSTKRLEWCPHSSNSRPC